jgi:putative ABC transport system substrate-binding protein
MWMLCGTVVGIAPTANAQDRVPHIAYFWLGRAGSDGETRAGLQTGLSKLGYRESRNIIVDWRYADGDQERLVELAAASVAGNPDLIVAVGGVVTRSIAKLTKTIPIVAVNASPVEQGFAANLAHPGGNITGLTVQVGPELAGKWIELLREIVPGVRRVAMLANALSAFSLEEVAQMRVATKRLGDGMTVAPYSIRNATDLPSVFATMLDAKPDALVVDDDPLLIANAVEIVALADRLPTICGLREFADAGGLISYGASIFDIWRRAGTYIDRILKGAKPADLPIEQPTKFELIINLKTAKALGLAVPPLLLAQADEVIQ